MLLWLQPSHTVARSSGSTSANTGVISLLQQPPPYHMNNYPDEDEKGAKLRRRAARAQLLNVVVCLGLFISTISVLTVQFHHHSPKIRGSSSNSVQQRHPPRNDTARTVLASSLPIHSMYRLSVKDASGILRSLEEYAGKVTLVVNTACQ
jgi:hypothetical protein